MWNIPKVLCLFIIAEKYIAQAVERIALRRNILNNIRSMILGMYKNCKINHFSRIFNVQIQRWKYWPAEHKEQHELERS